MPTPTKGPRLGGGPAHERLMLNNMATSLFKHGKITTTETRAKRLRPVAERLITFAKRGDLASRRRVMQSVLDKSVVHELFTVIAPQVNDRQGGYTRVTKLGFRKGDNAPMAVIELVLEPVVARPRTNKVKLTNNVATAAGAAAARLWRRVQQGRPQRSVTVRERQEVQALPRGVLERPRFRGAG